MLVREEVRGREGGGGERERRERTDLHTNIPHQLLPAFLQG